MREQRTGYPTQILDRFSLWTSGNRVSTVVGKHKLYFTRYLYSANRSTRVYKFLVVDKKLIHRIAIIFVSAAAFGIGLGQCISELSRGLK